MKIKDLIKQKRKEMKNIKGIEFGFHIFIVFGIFWLLFSYIIGNFFIDLFLTCMFVGLYLKLIGRGVEK